MVSNQVYLDFAPLFIKSEDKGREKRRHKILAIHLGGVGEPGMISAAEKGTLGQRYHKYKPVTS